MNKFNELEQCESKRLWFNFGYMLYRYLPERTDKDHRKPLTGYPVSNKYFNQAHPGHQEIMLTNIVVEFVQ
jgi:hypothetical protein